MVLQWYFVAFIWGFKRYYHTDIQSFNLPSGKVTLFLFRKGQDFALFFDAVLFFFFIIVHFLL